MIPLSLNRAAAAVGGRLLAEGCGDDLISAATIDSRSITGGELFVAIRGERVDGHDYAKAALDAGAAAVLIEDEDRARATGADPARLVWVPSTQDGLGALAKDNLARIRQVADPLVVGVTGSVGKTTTKDLLAAILAERGPIIAPPGSFNNELGLPLTVLRADETTATLVLEMGADRIGNLEHLTSIAPLDIGAVLAVARAHIGEFGGIENVAKAKSELVSGILPHGTAVLNADDHRVVAMAAKAPAVVTFAASGNGDVYASDIVLGADGRPSFTLNDGGSAVRVELGLVGAHHVSNALAAAAVARVAGLSLDAIATSLSGLGAASPHRMDVWHAGELTVIDDSYNANPDSMRAGLRALAQLSGEGQSLAVLGAMLELGEESDREHEAIGRELAELGIDAVIAVDAPGIAAGARSSGVDTREAASVSEAWPILLERASSGTILFKGSHGSKIWQLADRLKEQLC
ncbi:UDP-N-acetylmuramoyl-tripeptide--D-alanyl-D-alanine ligase [Flaviflexus huanghaiensis]|uniref:UDP-N-acetylmuramoyl-tripeptide--D-alanyl-D- alanine ligase n=1 Tax=Flaviflexus huanghaiensis TaxID=1111473 RepID=UPI0015FE4E26|nr:UDP-N-acetylmuramoyl-tripeptide--D-alanyl-D-alanine ligase [Flaviflexus huanghaiensis]